MPLLLSALERRGLTWARKEVRPWAVDLPGLIVLLLSVRERLKASPRTERHRQCVTAMTVFVSSSIGDPKALSPTPGLGQMGGLR